MKNILYGSLAFMALMIGLAFGVIALETYQYKASLLHTTQLADEDLIRVRDLMTQGQLAIKDEDAASRLLIKDIPTITGNINDAVIKANTALDHLTTAEDTISANAGQLLAQATVAVNDLKPIETQATESIALLQPVETGLAADTQTLHTLLADPGIPLLVTNLAATSGHLNGAATHIDGTTADVQQAVHTYLHPSLPTKIYHAITGFGISVAKFFW